MTRDERQISGKNRCNTCTCAKACTRSSNYVTVFVCTSFLVATKSLSLFLTDALRIAKQLPLMMILFSSACMTYLAARISRSKMSFEYHLSISFSISHVFEGDALMTPGHHSSLLSLMPKYHNPNIPFPPFLLCCLFVPRFGRRRVFWFVEKAKKVFVLQSSSHVHVWLYACLCVCLMIFFCFSQKARRKSWSCFVTRYSSSSGSYDPFFLSLSLLSFTYWIRKCVKETHICTPFYDYMTFDSSLAATLSACFSSSSCMLVTSVGSQRKRQAETDV